MKTKRVTAALLALAILLAAPGCKSNKSDPSRPAPSRPSAVEPSVSDDLPAVGEKLSGFVVTERGEIDPLGANTVTFEHTQSGATLLYLQNDDQNRRFSITYRTPVVDETDTNHIFEHAIIASSEKFPSSNLFFDLASKTYSTYVNAFTFPAFTSYPVSSQSEEQLLKMMDAYLSCMVNPSVLKDERIFHREALRYELESRDAPITLTGTVFSEDMGQLSDLTGNAADAVKDALYSGLTAANSIGMAHREYQDLTYEHLIETYERCYSFDNSLMILYGDLDYRRVLAMLDQEYLSMAQRKSIDVDRYFDELVVPGNEIVTVKSPAYQGDRPEALLSYAIDLSESTAEEWIYWDFFTTLFGNENSFWKQDLLREGITNQAAAAINNFELKPHLVFQLFNAQEKQRDDFRSSIERALYNVAKNGFSPDLIRSLEKTTLLSDQLTRELDQIEMVTAPSIANYWTLTGKTDYYTVYQNCLSEILSDKGQLIFKRLASQAISPKRSALVTTVATPGLAEQIEEEQQQFLLEKKNGMTAEQLDALIAETQAFEKWNQTKSGNSSLSISPAQLPDPPVTIPVSKTDLSGITSYTVPVNLDGVGRYAVLFDLGTLPQEQLFDYGLYLLLIGELPTRRYNADQVRQLSDEYLYGLSIEQLYPEDSAGENARPMSAFGWYCLTEDYEKSLKFLLEVLGKSDFSDSKQVAGLLEKHLPSYDLARTNDRLNLAFRLAQRPFRKSQAFADLVGGQEFYRFLKATLAEMQESPEQAREVCDRLSQIGGLLLHRDRLITMAAAPEETLPEMQKNAVRLLKNLPTKKNPPASYSLAVPQQRLGVAIETSNQTNLQLLDLASLSGWQGRYLPFAFAAQDGLLVPTLRFEMGAYSAGVSYHANWQSLALYTYSDPNIGASFDVMQGIPVFLRQTALTQEELDGYLLNAYSSACRVKGPLGLGFEAMHTILRGDDPESARNIALNIKNAALSDQAAAADLLEQALAQATTVTVGNDQRIRAETDCFDEVQDYRQP